MKIRQTILARSIRQVSAIYSSDYRPELIARLRDRYSFLRVPTTIDEIFGTDPQQGLRFQHGKFVQDKKSFVVELLQFLVIPPATNVIICDTRTSTDDADHFIDDYVKQANLIRPDMIVITEPPAYTSHLEFTMDKSIADFCRPPILEAAEGVNRLLASYKTKLPSSFEPSYITMMYDQAGIGGLLASPFSIERRVGFRYGSDVFFSQAPLRTRDHVEMLERLTR
jgi:hypothetical protein